MRNSSSGSAFKSVRAEAASLIVILHGHLRIAGAVQRGRAEQVCEHHGFAQIEPDVVLVGIADAAVHLDRLAGSEARALARDTAACRIAGAADVSSVAAAASTLARVSATSILRSAARWASAWKLPIGLPNCWRVLR